MYRNNDIIYDALESLKKLSGLLISIDSSRKEYDAIIEIRKMQFTVIAKTEIRSSNIGIVLSEINNIKNKSKRPIIIIAKFISLEMSNHLKNENINYVDVSGNAFIKNKDIHIYISGQKAIKIEKVNQSRAFQETGIKLIFNFLLNPDNLQSSYRDLAKQTGISVGSVSIIMNELEDLNFILRTDTFRKLKNTKELLNRWIIAYHDNLRPRLIKKRMRFILPENYSNWKNLCLTNMPGINLWGSEPASSICTNQLNPILFTIYTDNNWQDLISKMALIPDEKGDVEILQIFWNENENKKNNLVPPLLIYADLISSGIDRNIETAKIIFDNELQYIK